MFSAALCMLPKTYTGTLAVIKKKKQSDYKTAKSLINKNSFFTYDK